MEHIRLNCNHAVLSCDFDFKWKTLIEEEEYFSTNVNSSIKYSNVKPTLAIVHYLLYTEDFTQPSSSEHFFQNNPEAIRQTWRNSGLSVKMSQMCRQSMQESTYRLFTNKDYLNE